MINTMETLQKLLEPFNVVHKINVEWGEMDAAQHVNNTVYLRWCESGRIAYFDAMKINVSATGSGADAKPSNEGMILGYVDCKYIFPVTFPDVVGIGIKVAEIKSDRIVMESHMFSEKHGRLVAISKQEVLPYDYTKRSKIPVPKHMIDIIKTIEGKSFDKGLGVKV